MSRLQFNPRSARIQQAKARLTAAYGLKPGETPVVEPGVGPSLLTTRERVEDLDLMLDAAVGWAEAVAATDNDWPPVILPYCTVPMVPEAFGCQVEFIPGQSPWARHALSDIHQVWSLAPVTVGTSPLIRRQFEWIDYAQRKLGSGLAWWTPDIQSPFSVAAQIVEPRAFMMACIDDPKAVHHLVGMVTDYLVELTRETLRRIEHPGFPGANFPCIDENIGLVLADDTPLIMLSEAMYREFALPYNSRLGAEFGGIHVHSCGDWRRNLSAALDITNVRSIQLHAGPGEFPLPESAAEPCAFNQARGRVACFVDTNDVARGEPYRGDPRRHYDEYVIPRLTAGDMTGIILQSCGHPLEPSLEIPNAGLEIPNAGLEIPNVGLEIPAAGLRPVAAANALSPPAAGLRPVAAANALSPPAASLEIPNASLRPVAAANALSPPDVGLESPTSACGPSLRRTPCRHPTSAWAPPTSACGPPTSACGPPTSACGPPTSACGPPTSALRAANAALAWTRRRLPPRFP